MNLLERSHVDMAIARLTARILAEAFNEARRYPPSSRTGAEDARRIDAMRESALAWLTNVEDDYLFSLSGVCRILTVASGLEFSAADIAAQIAAGKRPVIEGGIVARNKRVSQPKTYRRRAA